MKKTVNQNPRIWTIRLVMTMICCALTVKLAVNAATPEYKEAALNQGSYTVNLPISYGTIYDRNGLPLVNRSSEYIAVVRGDGASAEAVLPYVIDKDEFYNKLSSGTPFTCKVNTDKIESDSIHVFEVPVRYDEEQTAQHLIGYMHDGEGVCGLEADYDYILRQDNGRTSVTFEVDGTGGALSGENSLVRYAPAPSQGVVTTIDDEIQHICEEAAETLEKGCIVVMEVKTGDILAMVSKPSYSLSNMEEAVSSEDSPLINRALYSYPVGSIFKLVTSAAAIDAGIEDFTHNCTGTVKIGSQVFGCHNREGHGMETLETALINSCNPYFISMSQKLSPLDLFETAAKLGFGRGQELSAGIISSEGYIPTVKELILPAERGNFCFGQGKLTATPVQITRMTCAIANYGILPDVRLIKGITEDGEVPEETVISGEQVLSTETAEKLRLMMIGAVYGSRGFNGKPIGISAGAKTSTAQTGRFDENGVEYCHGWITGFFPANIPEYAVTVLAEDGGYGNEAAAPVFKEIAEEISEGF
ncbi:MAG: hypothetical protein J6B17_03700 [Ruminococcus sp.]|nr:hypothetical protein [Ruminococcus sp.]